MRLSAEEERAIGEILETFLTHAVHRAATELVGMRDMRNDPVGDAQARRVVADHGLAILNRLCTGGGTYFDDRAGRARRRPDWAMLHREMEGPHQ